MKYNWGYIVALDVGATCIVQWHSLALASWQKPISLMNFLRNVTFGVSPQLHSKSQTTGGEKDFWTPQFSQCWVFGLTCRSKLLLFLSTVLLPSAISQIQIVQL